MAEAKKGRGCFFYGCLTLVVVAILAVVGIYFGVQYGLKKLVQNYTSPTGVAVAPVKLSTAEGDRAVKRVDEFTTQLQSGKAMEPLTLTSDELDYVVRNSPSAVTLKDHMHLMITNEQVQAEISLPLETFQPSLKGRYFNGQATFGVDVHRGVLALDLHSAEMNGKQIPDQALAGVKQNLKWQPQPNEKGADLLNNLEKVEVKNGMIMLVPKSKAAEPPKAEQPKP